jgi:hypothetical protein
MKTNQQQVCHSERSEESLSLGCFRIPAVIRILAGSVLIIAGSVQAGETNVTQATTVIVDGVTYEDVRWGSVTPTTVTLLHKTGIATVPLAKLPPDLQKRFGFNAQPTERPSEKQQPKPVAKLPSVGEVKSMNLEQRILLAKNPPPIPSEFATFNDMLKARDERTMVRYELTKGLTSLQAKQVEKALEAVDWFPLSYARPCVIKDVTGTVKDIHEQGILDSISTAMNNQPSDWLFLDLIAANTSDKTVVAYPPRAQNQLSSFQKNKVASLGSCVAIRDNFLVASQYWPEFKRAVDGKNAQQQAEKDREAEAVNRSIREAKKVAPTMTAVIQEDKGEGFVVRVLEEAYPNGERRNYSNTSENRLVYFPKGMAGVAIGKTLRFRAYRTRPATVYYYLGPGIPTQKLEMEAYVYFNN